MTGWKHDEKRNVWLCDKFIVARTGDRYRLWHPTMQTALYYPNPTMAKLVAEYIRQGLL